MPVDYDMVLKLKYGDYMKNVRSGGGHDYPYHEKQDEYLRSHGAVFPEYQYPDDVNDRKKNPTFTEVLNMKLNLLGQIHEKIEMLVNYGQQEVVLNLLQELQNVAVAIGESIERKTNQGADAITSLEQYCEKQ